MSEDSFPDVLVLVYENALPVHFVHTPRTVIQRAVTVLHLTRAVHVVVDPLTSVDVASLKLIAAWSVHLIILPVTFVFFPAKFIIAGLSAWFSQFSEAMFNFAATG